MCIGSGIRCQTYVSGLKRDDFSSNRHHALAYWLEYDLFRKPVSTFRDHALARRLGDRQREVDGGAADMAGAATEPEAAAVRLDDRFAQRQAEAKPLLFGGGERQERALAQIGREAGAVVA